MKGLAIGIFGCLVFLTSAASVYGAEAELEAYNGRGCLADSINFKTRKLGDILFLEVEYESFSVQTHRSQVSIRESRKNCAHSINFFSDGKAYRLWSFTHTLRDKYASRFEGILKTTAYILGDSRAVEYSSSFYGDLQNKEFKISSVFDDKLRISCFKDSATLNLNTVLTIDSRTEPRDSFRFYQLKKSTYMLIPDGNCGP